ncbi:putative isomerase, Enoyl-CoA hydratase, 3-hydroxyacyl-CoA dehydrogenase [Helianthus annuus]|nr:putative isomerase, Enoyl-CoA hydratase, 3-hydroxyacyl-CoA dehydrogenase [Helianthus annuus]
MTRSSTLGPASLPFVNPLVLLKLYYFFHVDLLFTAMTTGLGSKHGCESVHILSNTMETARKPSVAAIDGVALGGGLEVAMACNARISTSTTQLGLPELQLGIIPGGGGTQRLPRLVGLTKALEMMLPVHGEEAHNLGLVDAIVPRDELLEMLAKRR